MANPTSDFVHAHLRQRVDHCAEEVKSAFKGVVAPTTANPLPAQNYSQKFRITDKSGVARAFIFTASLTEESSGAAAAETTGVAGYDDRA